MRTLFGKKKDKEPQHHDSGQKSLALQGHATFHENALAPVSRTALIISAASQHLPCHLQHLPKKDGRNGRTMMGAGMKPNPTLPSS